MKKSLLVGIMLLGLSKFDLKAMDKKGCQNKRAANTNELDNKIKELKEQVEALDKQYLVIYEKINQKVKELLKEPKKNSHKIQDCVEGYKETHKDQCRFLAGIKDQLGEDIFTKHFPYRL